MLWSNIKRVPIEQHLLYWQIFRTNPVVNNGDSFKPIFVICVLLICLWQTCVACSLIQFTQDSAFPGLNWWMHLTNINLHLCVPYFYVIFILHIFICDFVTVHNLKITFVLHVGVNQTVTFLINLNSSCLTYFITRNYLADVVKVS